MPDWALALIALACGVTGLGVGYVLGYRNGRACGELRALHVTLTELRSRAAARPTRPAKSPLIRDE